MAVTHFVTQFIHVSRHFGVYISKEKIIVKKKLSWKCGLRFNQKIAYMSAKLLLDKSIKTKTNNNKKPWKRLQSLADSRDKTSSFGRFLRLHFQNSFP